MNKTRYKASELLEQSAGQLAQRHQQRLHRMTRQAVYGKRTAPASTRWRRLRWPVTVTAPVLSVMAVIVVWQFSQPGKVTPTAATPPVAAVEAVPAWVQDTRVPLAVLQNIEFYQWLENELDKTKQG